MSAEIGVLELQIHDNADQAGEGLNSLADALSRIRTAVGSDKIGLNSIGTQLNALAKQINSTQSGTPTVIKNITSLMNSLTGFSKIKKININTEAIDKLKQVISSGFNIGTAGSQLNQMRLALSGDWSNAATASEGMATLATGIKALEDANAASVLKNVAKAMSDYTTAYKGLPKTADKLRDILANSFSPVQSSEIDYTKAAEAWGESVKPDYEAIAKMLDQELTFHEPKELAQPVIEGLEQVESVIQRAKEPVQELSGAFGEVNGAVQSLQINEYLTDPISSLLERAANVQQLGPVYRNAFEGIRKSIETVTDGTIEDMRAQIDALFYTGNEASNFGASTSSAIETIGTAADNTSVALERVKAKIDDLFNFGPKFSEFVYKAGWFGSVAPRLMAGDNSGVSDQFALSVPGGRSPWADMWSPNFVMGEGTVQDEGGTVIFNNIREAADAMGISVREARDRVNATLETLHRRTAVPAFTSIEEAARATGRTVEDVTREINENLASIGVSNNVNSGYMERTQRSIEEHQRMRENAARNYFGNADRQTQEAIASFVGRSWEDLFGNLNQQTQQANAALEEVNNQMNNTSIRGERLREIMSTVAQSFATFARGVAQGAVGLGRGIGNLFSPLTRLIRQFARIARYRALRAVLRQITQGITEGLENLKKWSEYVGGEYYNDVQGMNAQLATMKNSLGAAIAPAIQAAIPIIKALTNAAIEAFNWVNQLISVLAGKSSWTRATAVTTDTLNNVKKAANGAGGAVKDMLADFDELNVLDHNGGGGGGGSGSDDLSQYENMFEEVTEFNESIKDITDFIAKNAEKIKSAAIEAGVAMLAWKISPYFGSTLGTIATLVAAGAVVDLTWKMTAMFDKEYVDTGKDGWLVADVITNAVGPYLAGRLVASVSNTGYGFVTAGFTLLISGGISYGIALTSEDEDRKNTLKTIALIKSGIGELLIGAGFYMVSGTVLGSFASMFMMMPMFELAAYITYAVVTAETEQKAARDFFTRTGKGGISVEKLFEMLTEEFNSLAEPYRLSVEAFQNHYQLVGELKEASRTISNLNNVVTSDQMLTQSQADAFKEAWETVFSTFTDLGKTNWETIFEGFNAALASQNEELKRQANEFRITAIQMEQNVTEIEAQWIDEMNTLKDKIAAGIATDEEKENYIRYMDALGMETSEAVERLNEVLESVDLIDFSATGDGYEAAIQLIKDAASHGQTVVDEIEAGLGVQLAAIEAEKERIRTLVKAGKLDPADAEAMIANMDEWADTFKQAADEKKDSIAQRITDTYRKILVNTKEVLRNYISDEGIIDYSSAVEYVDHFINPLITEMRDAGFEMNDIVREVFNFGDMLLENLDIGDANYESAVNFITKELSAMVQEAGGKINLGDAFFQTRFNLVDWDMGDIQKNEIANRLIDALGFDIAIESLADYYKLDIKDILRVVGYDQLTDENKKAFVKAMTEAYGEDGLGAAMHEAEHTAGMFVEHLGNETVMRLQTEGHRFRDTLKNTDLEMPEVDSEQFQIALYDATQLARRTGALLGQTIAGWKFTVSPVQVPATFGTAAMSAATSLAQNVQKTVGQTTYTVGNVTVPNSFGATALSAATTLAQNIQKQISGTKYIVGDVLVPNNLGSTAMGAVKSLYDSIQQYINNRGTIYLTIGLQAEQSVINGVIGGATSVIAKLNKEMFKASGAYDIPAGDIFVANEAGPELVGRMNGKNTVANQDQIIAGITQGVAEGQADQNALLREQNALLRQILAKDSSVRLGASAQLGKVTRQSLDMYSAMAGV